MKTQSFFITFRVSHRLLFCEKL